jgi:dolichyl-phosphate-mannose-protein mannosyltransferase
MAGGQIVADTSAETAPHRGDVTTGDVASGALPRHLAATPPQRRGRRLAVLGVLAAVLLGGTLRAMWATNYLPFDYHWDELTNVGVGDTMADDVAIDPGFYNYPALIFLAQSAVLIPASVFGDYDADQRSLVDMQTQASAEVQEPGLMLALRWATGVLPGMVTIATAGAICWVATRRAWVATLAALIVAISAIDLRFGIFVTPDALTGMAASLAALGASCVTIRPSRRLYLLTGAAIGLAGAAKYNAGVIAIGLVAAHLIVHRRPWADRRLLVEAAVVAGLVFCVTNLGAVLNPGDFVHGVGSEANHYSTGHFGNQGSSPAFNAGWMWRAFGAALPLALCSLATTSDRIRRIAIVLLVQSVGYFAFISLFPVRFARNLLPITGTVAAAAALGVLALVQRAALRRTSGRALLPAVVGVGMAVVLLAVPVAASVEAMTDRSEDPWSEAQAWIDENVAPGSRVIVENRAPVLDEDRYDVRHKALLGSSPFANYVFAQIDYVVAVSETFEPFFDAPDEFPEETASYARLLSDECVVHEFSGAGQRIVIAAPTRDC